MKNKWYQVHERRFAHNSLVSYHYRKTTNFLKRYGDYDLVSAIEKGYNWTVVLCFIDKDNLFAYAKTERDAKALIKKLDRIFSPKLIEGYR